MNKYRFLLLSCILGTLVFISAILISLNKHERSLRFQREKRLKMVHNQIEVQKERKLQLKQVCDVIDPQQQRLGGNSTSSPESLQSLGAIVDHMDHFIVDDTRKIIYCFVPKVASTNWKRVLLALGSQSQSQSQSTQQTSQEPNPLNPLNFSGNESHAQHSFKTLNQYVDVLEISHKLQTYLKFMFVRHPFERLLSAYRNKFENTYSDYFRQRFGRKIVKRLRANATRESLDRGHDVTFSEFLSYILELNSSDHRRDFNEHWRPIKDLCFPCLVDFDVIGMYETLVEDAELVLWRSQVFDFIRFPKREDTYSSLPSAALLKQYYSQIPEELLEKVSNLYSEDIALFGYKKQLSS